MNKKLAPPCTQYKSAKSVHAKLSNLVDLSIKKMHEACEAVRMAISTCDGDNIPASISIQSSVAH